MMVTNDHNEKTEQELYEEQQFLKAFTELKSLDSEMAGTRGDMASIYGRAKDIGWTKKDFEFARSLVDKDVGQVIADFQRKIRIARMFGHQLGRQLDLLDMDRSTEEERAYEDGRREGLLRSGKVNPYHPGNPAFNEWQRGNNDGTAFINKDLSAQMNAEAGAENE